KGKALKMTDAAIRTLGRSRAKLTEAERASLTRVLEDYRRHGDDLADWANLPAEEREELLPMAAETQYRLAGLLMLVGDGKGAEAAFRKAIDLLTQLAAMSEEEPMYRSELANARFDLALLLTDLGKRSAAEAEYRRAIALLARLIKQYPEERAY